MGVADSRSPIAPVRFADRSDAGRRLAQQLMPLRAERPVVVALPRGGVPVAYEISAALEAPLEVLAVRKLGAPHNPEFGIGAVAEDGTGVLDRDAIATLGVDEDQLEAILEREAAELRRRVELYRRGRPRLDLEDRTVIVVDDGIATGVTDAAALRALRSLEPRKIILAVPVCAPESAARLARDADQMICLQQPELFYGVGHWYHDFSQVSDEEVLALLGRSQPGNPRSASSGPR